MTEVETPIAAGAYKTPVKAAGNPPAVLTCQFCNGSTGQLLAFIEEMGGFFQGDAREPTAARFRQVIAHLVGGSVIA